MIRNALRRTTVAIVLVLVFFGNSASHKATAAEKRIAFVLGNANYQQVPLLENTLHDAQGVADQLRQLKFEVHLALDSDRAGMDRSLEALQRLPANHDLAFFFYAGHGIAVDGTNFIVPVDARLRSPADVDHQLVPVNEIISIMRTRAKQIIVLLDACRDNPFLERLSTAPQGRTVQRGLAKIALTSPKKKNVGGLAQYRTDETDILFGFATQPGNVAEDGKPSDRHSPFSKALIKHLRERSEFRDVLTRVRASVIADTGGAQVPWDQSSFTKPVFLARKKRVRVLN